MSDAVAAYRLAQEAVRKALRERPKLLSFEGVEFHALERLPPRITELNELAALYLSNTQIVDLGPLAGMKRLQSLWVDGTQITDLAPILALRGLEYLSLNHTRITDLRPLLELEQKNSFNIFQRHGLQHIHFQGTTATHIDKQLAELSQLDDPQKRARETLAYLRTLPPWPEPYTPAATPDGSPPQPIGDKALEQARTLSDLTPLAEELVQNPETGTFTARPKPIEKPDLLSATLGVVADAIEDVLFDPKNGLNAASLDIRKLRRTIERYGNDPQRIEMDFTTAHGSITRLIAVDELPASDENQALLRALEEGAMGIRATDTAVAVNRRILQEQKLREMPPAAIQQIAAAAPVLEAITEGSLQEQMREDIHVLTVDLPAAFPPLPGVTRADAILPGRDEAVRVLGRAARMMIALKATKDAVTKLRQSTGFQVAEIFVILEALIKLGIGLF